MKTVSFFIIRFVENESNCSDMGVKCDVQLKISQTQEIAYGCEEYLIKVQKLN